MSNNTGIKVNKTLDTILDEAAYLVSQGWRQGGYASDALGKAVTPFHPDACNFCMMGAVCLVAGEYVYVESDGGKNTTGLTRSAKRVMDRYTSVRALVRSMEYNDAEDRTQDEVVAALRGAAAQYRQEQA